MTEGLGYVWGFEHSAGSHPGSHYQLLCLGLLCLGLPRSVCLCMPAQCMQPHFSFRLRPEPASTACVSL